MSPSGDKRAMVRNGCVASVATGLVLVAFAAHFAPAPATAQPGPFDWWASFGLVFAAVWFIVDAVRR